MAEPNPFDSLSPDDIAELVRKMRKAGDSYGKMNAMDPYVDWGQRKALLWHLTRTGDYPTWEEPALWRELYEGLDHASGQDVLDFLAKIERFDAEDYRLTRVVEWWPHQLDQLVAGACARDPEAIEAGWRQLPDPVGRGVRFTLRRLGKLEAGQEPPGVVEALAREVASGNFPARLHMVVDGQISEVEVHDYRSLGEGFYALVDAFGDRDSWARAILDAALEVEFRLNLAMTIDGWRIADRDELLALLGTINTAKESVPALYDLLLDERDDAPEDLLWIARKLAQEGNAWESEVCALSAVLKLDRDGEAIPDSVYELVTFRSIFSANRRSDLTGVDRLVEALRAMPKRKILARIEELLDGEYTTLDPFIGLRAWADDPEVLERAIDALDEYIERREPNFPGLSPAANGLALTGPQILDRLAAVTRAAVQPTLHDTLQRGIIGILADMAEAGDTLPERHDRWVQFVDWRDPQTDDYYFGHYVVGDLETILAALPAQRREAIVTAQLDASKPHFGRALEAIDEAASDTAIGAAFDAIAAADQPPTGARGFNWFERLLRRVAQAGEAGAARFGPHLEALVAATDDAAIHNALQRALGDDRYAALLAAADVASGADKTHADKVRRLAEAHFETYPDAARAAIYICERIDSDSNDAAPDDASLNRIGGRPIGLEAWPDKDDDADLPMEHMLTIDLATMPQLRARAGEGVRAVALFVHRPDYNEAWMPFNADARVVLLTDADVERGEWEGDLPAGDERARAMAVAQIEVPSTVFFEDDEDPEVAELRDAVWAAPGRGGGMPIWLQSDEGPSSNFLVQFDESLVPMNLGDCGVMYLFRETAFWQCY